MSCSFVQYTAGRLRGRPSAGRSLIRLARAAGRDSRLYATGLTTSPPRGIRSVDQRLPRGYRNRLMPKLAIASEG
jgi:hypothetical protein